MYLATNRTNGALIYVLPFNYDEQYSTCSRVFNADVGPFWHSLNKFSLVGSVSHANKFRQRTRLMCHGHAIYPWLMVYIRPSSWLSCMLCMSMPSPYHMPVVPFKFEFWILKSPGSITGLFWNALASRRTIFFDALFLGFFQEAGEVVWADHDTISSPIFMVEENNRLEFPLETYSVIQEEWRDELKNSEAICVVWLSEFAMEGNMSSLLWHLFEGSLMSNKRADLSVSNTFVCYAVWTRAYGIVSGHFSHMHLSDTWEFIT